MPLPKPRINESEKDFIDRCIIDAEVQNEFPELDQRIAVCNNLYRPTTKAAKFDSQRFMFGLERKRDVQERNWSRQFSRFYFNEYKKGIKQFLETNNVSELGLFRFTDFEDLMVGMFTGMGWVFASWYMRSINNYQTKQQTTNPDDLKAIWEQKMIAYAKQYSAAKIGLIQGTALQNLRKIIKAFMADPDFMSKGIEEKSRILNNKFKQLSRWQAKRIVRTESTTISNIGLEQGAEAMFPKEQLEKRWITSMDGNERVWHGAMNNKIVDFDKKFTVPHPKGVDYMLRAGDPSASAANRVNCRCAVVPVPKPDEFD